MAQGQRRCTAGLALQAESIAAAGVKQQLGSCQGRAAVSDLPQPRNAARLLTEPATAWALEVAVALPPWLKACSGGEKEQAGPVCASSTNL